MANKNMNKAKTEKNDEFYTRLTDIEQELWNYREFFKDKIVYCNCDDGNWSNFWKYFYINFEFLELKELIATSYHAGVTDQAYKYTYKGGYGKTDYVSTDFMNGVEKEALTQKGDFRSDECIAIIEHCDVVVTNPPFSLFREFVATLEQYNKNFIIIGNMNAITYKNIFPLIKENKIWLGYNGPKDFIQPEGVEKKTVLTRWFTNIENNKRHHVLECYARYNEVDYPKYDNYNAIECGKVNAIPCDYTGVIGVPITFLDKFCPDQFEIIGIMSGASNEVFINGNDGRPKFYVNGKGTYARILIRWKPEAMPNIDEDGVITYGK